MQCGAFAVAFSLGLILLVSGSSLVDSSTAASIAALLTISVWILAYSHRAVINDPPDAERRQLLPPSRRQLALAGSMLLIAVVLGVSSSQLQSAVLDARWRRLLRKPPPQLAPAKWLHDGTEVLTLAKATNTRLNSESIGRFSEIASTMLAKPGAQKVASQALRASAQYRSRINGDDFHQPVNEFVVMSEYGPPWEADFEGYNPFGPTRIEITFRNNTVPAASAARLELLRTDPNQNHSIGPSEIILSANGTTVRLDGYWMKNVTIRNAVISYHGGPVRLENVVFANCNFQVATRPGFQLLEEVSKNSRVTFYQLA
jgi:hypothetical protein